MKIQRNSILDLSAVGSQNGPNSRWRCPVNRAIPLLLALAAINVSAQGWPAKPLRAIVPVGAGSSTDIVHRVVLEQLSEQLGQPIVVENRVGAGGTIGTAVVARAP